jgi:uncharacterized membrane protein
MTDGQRVRPESRPVTRAGGSAGTRPVRPATRKALTTLHVITSVTLLGHVLVVIALTLAALFSDDTGVVRATFRLEQLTVHTVGIPLALLALLTGVTLSLVTPWGLFRHKWVVAKLVLLLATVACGIAAVRPWVAQLVEATGAGTLTGSQLGTTVWLLLAAGLAQCAALVLATTLSVYKPKGRIGGQ